MIEVKCDFCGKTFYRDKSQLKGKKYHFCSRSCLADFSSKSKNPNGYADLKDLHAVGETFRRTNAETNKTRMTPAVKEKLRNARLNTGEGKTYTKIYGKPAHRVVAEQILGRPLLPGEVVHHIDGDKRNNNPNNLRVFPSQAEHTRFHKELSKVLKMINS